MDEINDEVASASTRPVSSLSNIIPANSVLFGELCDVFDQIYKHKKGRRDQNKILENYINAFKLKVAKISGNKNSTFFPILRLLLPNCERERNPYNLKESKLGALLIKVLSLDKQSDAAQKLLNFRSGEASSDFASVAYFVFKNRVGQSSSKVTVGDINDALDTIASAQTGHKGPVLDEAFSFLMKKLTPSEFKWILRIVLKDLKLGMSIHRILAALHPDAPEVYGNCNCIRKVCEEFEDGDTQPPELGAQIFYAICPMLSERLDILDINQLSINKVYQIEEKFDGERFQMHMDDGVFEYFSRKGFKYSDNYGKTFESGLVSSYLKDCFNINVKSLILDGEMMGWHKEKHYFGSKGFAYDIKKVNENSKHRPCYCVYDVLYYNGKSLIGPPDKGGLTLRERLQILDKIFTDVPGVIQLSKRQIVKDISDVFEGLNRAIDNQEEGIVVKDLDSYYIANKRNAGWYKIKPEYTEGAITDLDLVIVGADEAENKRQGRAKSFYVACVDRTSESPLRWVCVGAVSSGFTYEEKERVCAFLQTNWCSSNKKPPPENLFFNKIKPDLWILPEYSIVVQIKATELVRSARFGTDYTLSFPRVTRIREDKPVGDTMTLEQFNLLVSTKNPVEKLCTKRINESQIDQLGMKLRKTRTSKVIQVAKQFRPVVNTEVVVTSRALLDRKICVLSEDEDCKKDELIKIVESHGGKHVVNIGVDTWCSVAGLMTVRVRNLIATKEHDIAPTSWLRALPASDTPCALVPLDMLTMKKESKLRLCHLYDTYGDSYTEETNEDTLKKCFDKMNEEPQICLTKQEKLAIDGELFGDNNPVSFLRRCNIYVEDYLLGLLAQMYGATVTEDIQHLTHAVLSTDVRNKDLDSFDGADVKVVSEEWLRTCIDKKELVSENKFLL